MLAGLPVDERDLPSTPTVRESVERATTVPAVLAMLVGLHLGEVIAYRSEKRGALVQNVVPVCGLETPESNAGSVPLEFHVENASTGNAPTTSACCACATITPSGPARWSPASGRPCR